MVQNLKQFKSLSNTDKLCVLYQKQIETLNSIGYKVNNISKDVFKLKVITFITTALITVLTIITFT
jgi:hypothetical protein